VVIITRLAHRRFSFAWIAWPILRCAGEYGGSCPGSGRGGAPAGVTSTGAGDRCYVHRCAYGCPIHRRGRV